MKKNFWFITLLLGAGLLCTYVMYAVGTDTAGHSRSATELMNFSLSGTLEPDEIPGMAQSSDYTFAEEAGESSSADRHFTPDGKFLGAGGPVRLPKKSAADSTNESILAALTLEHQIQPPKQIRYAQSDAAFENEPVQLVQYKNNNGSKQKSAQQPKVENKPETAADSGVQLPPEHVDSLKKSIRNVLIANARRPITTQHNSPGEILLMALPYGADAKVYQPNPNVNPRDKNAVKGSYIYSIGTLCWNYPCNGRTLLRSDGKNVVAKVGNGYQPRPASLLAMLAMSNIMPNYEIKADGGVYSISHLISSERAGITKGSNLSMALIGLSFYGNVKETWKNDMGETWSIEKMVVEELNRTIDQGTSDVTDWLLGLTAAVNLYEEEGYALRGPIALAKKQLGIYHDFVLSVQNENYLWHPKFFLFKGVTPNTHDAIYSGGHILRWLVTSLPENRLEDAKVRRAVANLAATLNQIPANTPAGSMSEKQLEGIGVALQALSVYYQRMYGRSPLEMPQQPEQQQASAANKTAQK
ncbi:MAG: hypothetical protein FWE67_13590 [Planctomycetaceae bacterium]|nr:hypothetical protein [Planctomycetaceae bacterium]